MISVCLFGFLEWTTIVSLYAFYFCCCHCCKQTFEFYDNSENQIFPFPQADGRADIRNIGNLHARRKRAFEDLKLAIAMAQNDIC